VQQAVQAAQEDAMRREQALHERIASLERQVQAGRQSPALPGPPPYAEMGFSDLGFGYPWGFGLSYVVPSQLSVPRRFVGPSGRLARPGGFARPNAIVNSGPVFANPVQPFGTSRFAQPGMVPGAVIARGRK
jgi:hypothetical protein